MKKSIATILPVLMVLFLTFSCEQNKQAVLLPSLPTQVILGAFSDIKNSSSMDLSELQNLPLVVDLSGEMTPVKNQANRGSCSFFTALALVEAAIKKDQKKEVNLSEEFLIYKTKNLGFSSLMESSTVQENLGVLKRVGMLLESDSPYRPSWFVEGMPCARYSNQAGSGGPFRCFSHDPPSFEALSRVVNADQIEVISIGKTTNNIIKYLALEGRPISITLLVHKDGWPKTGDVFYNEEMRQECLRDRSLCGGHSVILTGYDLNKKVFYFKNSWGEEWGHKGYGTVTFNTVDLYSDKDYQSVQLRGDLTFPEEKKVAVASVKNFILKSEIGENHSLTVKMIGEINGVSGHFLYATGMLVKQISNFKMAPNDQSTQIIALSSENAIKFKEVAAKSSYSLSMDDPRIDKILWSEESPLFLNISDKLMELPEIKEALSSKETRVFLRGTLYDFSDTGYRILKRIYKNL